MWHSMQMDSFTSDDFTEMTHCLLIQTVCVSFGPFAHMLHFWGTRPSNRWIAISQGFLSFWVLLVLYQFQSANHPSRRVLLGRRAVGDTKGWFLAVTSTLFARLTVFVVVILQFSVAPVDSPHALSQRDKKAQCAQGTLSRRSHSRSSL